MTEFIDPLFALTGLVVGVTVGLTGVGGGSLMTPLLVLLFGIAPSAAVGTDLLYAGLTKSVGVAVHQKHGSVDWRVVGFLSAGSIPASVATLAWLHAAGPRSHEAEEIVSFALGIALIGTAASILCRDRIVALVAGNRSPPPALGAGLTVLTGLVIGALVSISSVGAGAIGVTALYFLYPHLPARRIVGSDIAHAVPLTLVAGSGHFMLGTVDLHMLGSLLAGSIPGIVLGSLCAALIPDLGLRYALAFVLVLVGGRLALS